MKTRYLFIVILLGMLMLSCTALPQNISAISATQPSAATQSASAENLLPTNSPPKPTVAALCAPGVELITGDFTYTNEFVLETYYVEHAVALLDLTGYLKRDKEWELPVESQVLGYMNVDTENNRGTFRLQLPVRPAGESHDVDNDGTKDNGVQIFAVGYSPNLTGDVFSVGDDRSLGWPTYLASIVTDTENQDEVIGGKLVVWAADDQQAFPAGFGDDGLLFTEDDPIAPLPAGYSVIDLDKQPFDIYQGQEAKMKLYEPQDIAVKDFSNLSFSEAFDKMFEIARKEYAFNGMEGKQPNWDKLYAELSPRVKEAEQKNDVRAYYAALRDFTYAFKDGHVGLSSDLRRQEFRQIAGSGYGFTIRELDDGSVIVTYITENGPAQKAGIKVGAEITEFNRMPIGEAIGKVLPFEAPYSTDFGLRTAQALYLLRAPAGTKAEVTFINPGDKAKTVTLQAVQEFDSFLAGWPFDDADPDVLPVEYKTLETQIGYIRINSNYDDLGLAIRIFERALKIFEQNQVAGLIIDMRFNFGGAPLGLAGFLYDQEIPLGQLEYYSDKTGKFEPEGPREKVYPNVGQYRFDEMVLLVDQNCYSACEIEAYGFRQVPGMVVMGQFPTAGVEAETARGQFKLPGDIELTIPTGRFTLPDGSIFLEGKGVQLTQRIPITRETVLSNEDVVLKAAEQAILE
ncbi:MAG: S41 family peptidase [Anaerolineales bacterium]